MASTTPQIIQQPPPPQVSTIMLTGSDVVAGTDNSTYRYEFKRSVTFNPREAEICLSVFNIYFSWFNISSALNNNVFQYKWFGATSTSALVTYTITITDGYYSINDINEYITAQMGIKGHCLKNTSTGKNVAYIVLQENSIAYSVQLTCYAMPTALPSGYSVVASSDGTPSWAFPSTKQTPVFIVPSTNNFGKLIGYSSGSYPSSLSTTDTSMLGSDTPTINPISSVIVRCNLVKNEYAVVDNVMYSFSPDTSYGGLIQVKPSFPLWSSVRDGCHQYVEISLYDQDLNRLVVKDKDLMILMSIKRYSK